MVNCKSLTLYGAPAAIEHALVLLENQPQVKRVSARAATGEVRLLLTGSLSESDLVTLLAHSGVSGFMLHI